MTEKNSRKNETVDALFDAILSLESREECYAFFEDLCTVKEISDMAQRLEAAKLLLGGRTYDQIVKEVEISTATISRINRCIQYGTGGYQSVIEKISAQEKKHKGPAPDAKRPPVSGRPWGMLYRFAYFRQKVSGSKSGSSQKRVMISV